ncbi:hypothetical protein [Mesobacillus subterraneus]|uniref:Uncharacterized protein n=1 Tax=Mesobacillus subterraneus TaxID=285983 RepID=A0A427TDP9_9BACI|nr:hypothetical protein [Mesobacillus subterraneus]RSD20625.1 hypothetical protein EJA10_22990 [Mesobacillus subterraneus]
MSRISYDRFEIKKIHGTEIIPSVDPTRKYYIECADVDWKDGKGIREKVIYTLIIRNNTPQYYPAHILPDDLDSVMDVVAMLKGKFLKKE